MNNHFKKGYLKINPRYVAKLASFTGKNMQTLDTVNPLKMCYWSDLKPASNLAVANNTVNVGQIMQLARYFKSEARRQLNYGLVSRLNGLHERN